MKLLVCGGRDFNDLCLFFDTIDDLSPEPDLIIQGGATGADALARRYAEKRGIQIQTFEAEWSKYGNAAGPIRNRKMLAEGKPDLVVAFPGGKGTADMVRRASVAGVPVHHVAAVSSPSARV